jgi:hypothetical protein
VDRSVLAGSEALANGHSVMDPATPSPLSQVLRSMNGCGSNASSTAREGKKVATQKPLLDIPAMR